MKHKTWAVIGMICLVMSFVTGYQESHKHGQ